MGKLIVVGIGPGNYENMTIKADRALRLCDVIIGYHVYVDLVRERYPDKEFLTTPMTQEMERCRMALDLAKQGKTVAMVCSGDSGIYGMAALIYELRGECSAPGIEVIPGLTAACSGAALLGAPLTHDFAVVSLSDRLTAWEKIEKRLEAAAAADLSIVLYNPASHGRPDHLRRACDILLRHLPEDRLCGVTRNIGREGENKRMLSLGELRSEKVDMFCTVFIGNDMTREIAQKMVTPRGYRDV
ncbi:MAG: precorrin-3B C(17)-methyltransferase [Bacillota bacterium]|nr:precorrin-3B C(17)-methyltransferase [Bacillota bacterium]